MHLRAVTSSPAPLASPHGGEPGVPVSPDGRASSPNNIATESAIALHAPARRAGSKRRFSDSGVNATHGPSSDLVKLPTAFALHSVNATLWPRADPPIATSSAALHEHVLACQLLARIGRPLRHGQEL